MANEHSHVYATPLGAALIRESDGVITQVSLIPSPTDAPDSPSTLTNACANELLEYLAGKRRVFGVACAPAGTEFQLAVWRTVAAVPYGQMRTCTDIAHAMGQPNARRQVGRAAAACPCPILIPVHRVSSLDDPLSHHLRELESRLA